MLIAINIRSLVLLYVSVMVFVACGGSPAKNDATTDNEPTNTSVASAPPLGGSAQTPAAAAEELIKDLYKQHDAKKSPFFQTKDRARVDKYFVKPLADQIWNDAKTANGEIGAIDFDPLYNAQDIEIKELAVGTADLKGDNGTLPLTFKNFGEKQTVTFALKRVGDTWKIEDIRYSGGNTLQKTFKANNTKERSSDAVSGEFEGKCIVGDTSCTVSPQRMAFQVRWAKGSGVEYFYFKDANVFESEPDKNGLRNEFRFDDENYDTGTFYRGDGKTFAVKRGR